MVGVTKSAAAALAFQSLLADLGVPWVPTMWTDSSASIGMCSRQGIGKVRRMDAQAMWIQQRVRSGDLDLRKVAGEHNPADILTKANIPRERVEKLLSDLPCNFEDGGAQSVPLLKTHGGQRVFQLISSRGGLDQQEKGRQARSGSKKLDQPESFLSQTHSRGGQLRRNPPA